MMKMYIHVVILFEIKLRKKNKTFISASFSTNWRVSTTKFGIRSGIRTAVTVGHKTVQNIKVQGVP